MRDLNITRTKVKATKLTYGLLVCFVGALFYCYEFILRIIPGVLQTELSASFGHISATSFGTLSAFYYFAYSPMQLPVGILVDRYGPRSMLTMACFCCAVGSYLFASSSSLAIAGSGRFLVGFGSSFAFVGVLVLSLNWLPHRFFSSVAGLVTTLGMLGVIYGEVNLTKMADNIGLRDVLSNVVLFGFVLTLVIFVFIRDGRESEYAKREVIADFFRDAWQVMSSPSVWVIGVIGACLYTSLSVFGELWGKTYLEQAHNLSKIQASQAISLLFLGWAIGAPLAGFISDWSHKRIQTIVLGSIGALISISTIIYINDIPFLWLSALLFIYGIFSSVEIIVFVMGKEITGAKLSSTVFATVNMIVTLGGVIFQPLVGKLLDMSSVNNNLAHTKHVYSAADYKIALSILPISLVIVLIFSFFLIHYNNLSQENQTH